MKNICLCCGYRTIDVRGDYQICPVCYWEDDRYVFLLPDGNFSSVMYKAGYDDDEKLVEIIIDMESDVNNDLTLRQARANYLEFGACQKEKLKHCRKPTESEMVQAAMNHSVLEQ